MFRTIARQGYSGAIAVGILTSPASNSLSWPLLRKETRGQRSRRCTLAGKELPICWLCPICHQQAAAPVQCEEETPPTLTPVVGRLHKQARKSYIKTWARRHVTVTEQELQYRATAGGPVRGG